MILGDLASLQSTGSSLSPSNLSLCSLDEDFLLQDLLGHGFVTFLISDVTSAGPLKPSGLVARTLHNIILKISSYHNNTGLTSRASLVAIPSSRTPDFSRPRRKCLLPVR